MKETKNTLKHKINSAYQEITAGVEQVAIGCKLIVKCLDEDRAEATSILHDRGVVNEFIDLIEKVGRGRIHPRLLFLPGPGPERIQRVPLAEQERLLNVGVFVAKQSGQEFKKVLKAVVELNSDEAVLAINAGGNVPFESQVETLKQVMIRKTFKLLPFTLEGDTLLARANCRIPFDELERIYHSAARAHAEKVKTLEADIKRGQVAR